MGVRLWYFRSKEALLFEKRSKNFCLLAFSWGAAGVTRLRGFLCCFFGARLASWPRSGPSRSLLAVPWKSGRARYFHGLLQPLVEIVRSGRQARTALPHRGNQSCPASRWRLGARRKSAPAYSCPWRSRQAKDQARREELPRSVQGHNASSATPERPACHL